MFRPLSSVCAGVLSLFVTITMAYCQESDSPETKSIDPTGTWKWERTFNDNAAEFSLKLNWDGKKLSGKYSAFDQTSDIEDTKLENDKLSFLAKREFNGNAFEVKFDGTAEPDDIKGTIRVDFGNGPQDFDWHAKRAVETEDLLGTWSLKVETPNGLVEPRLTITEMDDKLHGAYVSPFGEREAKNVTLVNNELSWEISGERDGNQFKVVYTGKPRGNRIEGNTEFDFGGNTGTVGFTGERTPPEEKAGARTEEAQEAEPKAEDTTTPAES